MSEIPFFYITHLYTYPKVSKSENGSLTPFPKIPIKERQYLVLTFSFFHSISLCKLTLLRPSA